MAAASVSKRALDDASEMDEEGDMDEMDDDVVPPGLVLLLLTVRDEEDLEMASSAFDLASRPMELVEVARVKSTTTPADGSRTPRDSDDADEPDEADDDDERVRLRPLLLDLLVLSACFPLAEMLVAVVLLPVVEAGATPRALWLLVDAAAALLACLLDACKLFVFPLGLLSSVQNENTYSCALNKRNSEQNYEHVASFSLNKMYIICI